MQVLKNKQQASEIFLCNRCRERYHFVKIKNKKSLFLSKSILREKNNQTQKIDR